jgi:non-ribosomal peptide synthetase component F
MKPKAVIIEHGALATCCQNISAGLYITSDSRLFQFASFTYDLSVADVFCAFSREACLCVPSESDRLNNIPHAFASLQINHVTLTPAVASQFNPEEVPTLKTLVLGGEALPQSLVDKWADKVTLLNTYGITETVRDHLKPGNTYSNRPTVRVDDSNSTYHP